MKSLQNIAGKLRYALPFFLSGCATITASQAPSSIDSVPRGTVVTDSDGNHLGETPFFLEERPRSTLNLKVEGLPEVHKIECKYRWSTLLGNFAWSAAGVPGLVFVSVGIAADLYLGTAYECPLRNTLVINGTPHTPEIPPCRRYFIAAPGLEETQVQKEKIISLWLNELRRRTPSCLSVVSLENSDEFLAKHNYDEKGEFNPETLHPETLNKLAYTNNATHIAVLSREKNNSVILGQEFDVHTGKKVRELEIVYTEAPSAPISDSTRYLSYIKSGLPNSVELEKNAAEVPFVVSSTHRFAGPATPTHKFMSRYVNSLRVSRVLTSDTLTAWEVRFGWSFQGAIHSLNNKTTLTRSNGAAKDGPTSYSVVTEGYFGFAGVTGDVFFNTPAGVLPVRAGMGLVRTEALLNDIGLEGNALAIKTQGSFIRSIFWKMFLGIHIDMYFLTNPVTATGGNHKITGLSIGSASLGIRF